MLLLRDGEEVRRVGTRIVALRELATLPTSAWEEFTRELSLLEEKGGMRLAIASLARRAYHSRQLLDLLKKHFVSDDVAKKVISLCLEKGYLNDTFWLEQRVSSLRARGKSSRDIAFRLKKEGISPPPRLNEDEEVLARLISKKYPALLEKSLSQKDQARIIRALMRRGFSFQDVYIHISVEESF